MKKMLYCKKSVCGNSNGSCQERKKKRKVDPYQTQLFNETKA